MLWVKAFHIIAVICWMAGLFYLPRLFVYHAMAADVDEPQAIERFKTMERKLYRGIMTPTMIASFVLGIGIVLFDPSMFLASTWFWAKVALAIGLLGYHHYCGRLIRVFEQDMNVRSHVFYRWFNEAPLLFLVPIVILVIIKPF